VDAEGCHRRELSIALDAANWRRATSGFAHFAAREGSRSTVTAALVRP
jgi:hypothetical protein